MEDIKTVVFAAPGRVAAPAIARLAGWRAIVSYRKGGSSERAAEKIAEKYRAIIIDAEISTAVGAAKLISQAGRSCRLAVVNVASQFPPREAFRRWEAGKLIEDDWKYYRSNFGVMQSVTREALKWHADSGARLDIISFGDERARRYFNGRHVHPFAKAVIDFTEGDARADGLSYLRKMGGQGRDLNPYLLSKLLILHATRELALSHPGVAINAIAPGIMEPSPNDTLEEAEAYARKATLLGRMSGAGAAADKIFHLLEDNAYMTGDIIPMDGGLHLLWLEGQEKRAS